MNELQRLMNSFSTEGKIVLNRFSEVCFTAHYKTREWNPNKIDYEGTFDYDGPEFAPKKYTKIVKNNHDKFFKYETDETLIYKVLEWLSRAAHKEGGKESRKWYLEGINKFLGTRFNDDEIGEIYTYLGNNVNRELCIEFVESGYDVSMLPIWRKKQKEKRND